jgi:hypothetical protein
VQNYFLIETEAAHRRGEWERVVVAAERRAQVRPRNRRTRWSHVASRTLASLRALATPWVPVTCWNDAGEPCAGSLEGGRATAT